MIGKLTGQISDIMDAAVIIDVNGVGYLVNVLAGEFLEGEEVELFIHTAVKENDISLWGFDSADKLKLFNLLLSVSGVGLKTAMALITEKGVREIVRSIVLEDPAGLKVSGVGKKTAERILIDLKGKVDDMSINASDGEATVVQNTDVNQDVLVAIESLGYRRQEVLDAFKRLSSEAKELSTEDLIREILKNI